LHVAAGEIVLFKGNLRSDYEDGRNQPGSRLSLPTKRDMSELLLIGFFAFHSPADSEESVTTDDLIPFLVYIIVLSKPKYLRTNIFLMESLTFVDLSTNEMGCRSPHPSTWVKDISNSTHLF